MLPKNLETPRGLYLQRIVNAATVDELVKWPMPNNDDYAIVGGFVVLFSYVEFNSRRILETCRCAGLLADKVREKLDKLSMEDVAKSVQSLTFWNDEERNALAQLEEFRSTRNLMAHFTLRRFPSDDAFFCLAKSARDYERQFGRRPGEGEALTAIVDRQDLQRVLTHANQLQNWLAKATAELEQRLLPSS